jgi:cytochrome c-type biogenesis protein CcmF
MDIAYKGEHLLPGQLGQFFIVLAFGAALLSFISYYFATTENKLKTILPGCAWAALATG